LNQKLKLIEKDFEDKLVNSQNNVKDPKAKHADSQTTFSNSHPTDTHDRPGDPPQNPQNNDKPPDFQTLLATKDQKGHNIIKTWTESPYFYVKCTLCRETEALSFENPQNFIFRLECPFAKPPDFQKYLATKDLKGHSVKLLETFEQTSYSPGEFRLGCSKCNFRHDIYFSQFADYVLPYKCLNA